MHANAQGARHTLPTSDSARMAARHKATQAQTGHEPSLACGSMGRGTRPFRSTNACSSWTASRAVATAVSLACAAHAAVASASAPGAHAAGPVAGAGPAPTGLLLLALAVSADSRSAQGRPAAVALLLASATSCALVSRTYMRSAKRSGSTSAYASTCGVPAQQAMYPASVHTNCNIPWCCRLSAAERMQQAPARSSTLYKANCMQGGAARAPRRGARG